MKKVIRLTEAQLENIIRKVISEEDNKSYKGSLIDIAKKENLLPSDFTVERKLLADPNSNWEIMNVIGKVKVAGVSNNLIGKQFKTSDFIDLTDGEEIIFKSITNDTGVHYTVDRKGKNGIRIYGSWN
jgi:hypothetical protein